MSDHDRFRRRLLRSRPSVRYAVVGLGHIAQVAVLPAFANARRNSELTALVSGDPDKRATLSKRYGVPAYSYEQYDELLDSGRIDAVYIALPNDMHRSYAVRAARAGVHVLCEKPLAVTVEDCNAMIEAAAAADVKLMTAYRLHFEKSNLEAIELLRDGKIGVPKLFFSEFAMQVREGDIRTGSPGEGGGAIFDLGVYCINAARYLFRAEPIEAVAMMVNTGDPRFAEVEEATGALLRFPGDKLASFSVSFGAADVSSYRVVGTEGDLRVEPAYEYAFPLVHRLTAGGKTKKRTFKKRDQFAPELLYFSDCIRFDQPVEPDGHEGMADVRVIEAIRRSARTGSAVFLPPLTKPLRPSLDQEIARPAHGEPSLVETEPPSA